MLKRRVREKFTEGTVKTRAQLVDFIENKYVDEFDYGMCERSIKGTKIGEKWVGGYASRLTACIKVQGGNLTCLTRKQRRELDCLTEEELREYSIDGDAYESDDEGIDPYIDDSETSNL